ncbi:hypothetical protein ACWD4N_48675 [Streptomyces sp. NPDC002586]
MAVDDETFRMLEAVQALLFHGDDDAAVPDQAGGTIVAQVDAQYVHVSVSESVV